MLHEKGTTCSFIYATEQLQFNYALTDIHIEEHVKLVDQIKELDLKNLDEDAIDFGKKILKFLISWLFKHISGSDFLYRDLFIENNVK